MTPLTDITIGSFLDAVASDAPAPGGGAVAALVVAQAAGLAAMAGRFSIGRARNLDASICVELVAQADRLRAVAAPLADADADAYQGFLDAIRLPKDGTPARAAAIASARSRAADVPLNTAEVAAQVVEIAVRVAEDGNPQLRGDAIAAALLGAAAARIAAVMVADNLARTPDDARLARSSAAAAAATRGAERLCPSTSGMSS